MIDIEIEAHADSIGRDEKVDIAGLIERDLRISRARAECPEHNGGPAALAPDELGDGIDFGGRKCHHRRARRQPGNFLLARIGQPRQSWARDEVGPRNEILDHLADGLRAEQKRFLASP